MITISRVCALIIFGNFFTTSLAMIRKVKWINPQSPRLIASQFTTVCSFLKISQVAGRNSCSSSTLLRQKAIMDLIAVKTLEEDIQRGQVCYQSVENYLKSPYVNKGAVSRLCSAAIAYKNSTLIDLLIPQIDPDDHNIFEVASAAKNSLLMETIHKMKKEKAEKLTKKLYEVSE